MRDYDAFMVLTESGRELYFRFVMDTSLFLVIPNGVDLDHFKPMNKAEARSEVAGML